MKLMTKPARSPRRRVTSLGFDFAQALNEYLGMSIGEALESENVLHRALAMTDRRVGKRRLVQLSRTLELENPVVQVRLRVRCDAESIRTPSRQAAR